LEKCKNLFDNEETEVEVRFRVLSDEWQWFRITDKVFEREDDGTVSKVIGTAQNIHNQKNNEKKLKEEHRRLKNAQAIGHIGSFERKIPGNMVTYSEEFYRILGLEPKQDEIEFDEFMSHVHPDDREAYRTSIAHIDATGEPLEMITRVVRPDGGIRYVHRRAAMMYDEDGKPGKVYGTVQDVTEKIISEVANKRSEWLMRSTEIVAGTGSYEVDLLTNKIYLSDGLYKLLGAEPGIFEPTQEWLDSLSHPEDATRVSEVIKEALVTKQPYTYSRRIYRNNGEIRILETQGNVITNAQGNPVKMIGLVQDVTDRKKAEEELRKSQALLKSVFDASPNSIVLYDTLYDNKGKAEDFEFRIANLYTFETFGLSRDIIGKRISEEFPAALTTSVIDKLRITAEKGEPTDFEALYGREGFQKWFHWRAARLDSSIIVTTEDITERMKSRETLQQMLNGSLTAITILESLRDDHGNIIDFVFKGGNKAAEALNKISTEELIGKRLLELFPGVKEFFFHTYVNVVEKGEPSRTQRFYNNEHYDHWLDVSAVKNGDGIILSYLDITEQKKAEQELVKLKDELEQRAAESEDRFRSLVTASSDTVYKMSPDWEFLYSVDGKNFLANTDKATSNWVYEYVPEHERQKLINKINESIRTKSIFDLEHEVFDINGNIGWIHSRAIPKLNDEGEIVEWLGAASNITARKKAEERQDFLLQLSDGFRTAEDPEEILFKASAILGKFLGASRVGYAEDLGDGKTVAVTRNYTNGVSGIEGIYTYEEYGPELLKELKAGRTVIRDDIAKDPNLTAAEKNAYSILDLAATVNVPLLKKEHLFAILFIHFNKPHHFTEGEIALIEETADRTKAALERARAEKALREAQENLNIALEAAQMGTWILDLSTNTTKRNFRHDQIFGYNSLQKVWNKDIARKHVLKEDYEIFDAAFATATKTGKLHFEVRVRWQDGSIHWMEVTGHYYFNENGEPVRVAGVNFEVTERRQAEQALRESEQRFRNLVEASALAVWETNPKGEVEVDSPSWRNFTGQTIEEWKGTGWKNVVHPDDLETAIREWEKAVTTRQNFDSEYRIRSAQGSYRWTNIKGIPIFDTQGRVIKWSGMNLDINDRKEAEAELRKAKEAAEEASRAKDDFVSTMSHEIRTPLNAIIGLTNLLMEQKPREDQKENLSSLSFSARNLLVLINDILDFSKLEAGKMEISEIHFNLPDLLSNLQKAHQPQARANGSEIKLDLDIKIPEIIATDQVKLSQILHNLVSNAVKFTGNGEIKIIAKLNRQDEDLVWLDFIVEDTGIGIAEDKADHIFDKFAQAESSTVRNYGGTGLGLSITKLLLELLGSEIKLESKLGEGSRFYFTLPVKQGIKETVSVEPEDIKEEIKDLGYLRLLLVEDVKINRKIIMQFLQNWWLLVPDEAVNGKEAVEKAKKRQYDLILMDVRMPEMDGYEATSLIRKLPGYEETPILALTADKNQEVQQTQHSTQFNDMLTKPFEPRELKRKILHHLSISVEEVAEPTSNTKRETEVDQQRSKNNKITSSPPAFEISRYEKISAGNKEILGKLIKSAQKAFEIYKEEFSVAANEQDLKTLSDLVHKNTTSIHYVQANQVAVKIEEFRDLLRNP
ncbi:MAG TPA: PAS domain-containing protein, partial [Gillisia sp.]|nr:PAS domain-containing protein [Gillisia sp.]